MFQWLFNNSDNNIVILDKSGVVGNVLKEKNIDIILSPAFYWFVEKKFSVKFSFQIKEYLPSVFEEFTNIQELSYQVIPKGDGVFWLFAYDDKAIIEALTNSNIDISKVSKIYFAQNIFLNIKSIDLENGFLLASVDGIISRVPNTFIKNSVKFCKTLKEKLSLQNGIVLKRYTNFINKNLVKKIMVPLSLLMLLEGAEALMIWNKNKQLTTQKENIFKNYNLPQTSFQNRAILKTLQTKIKSQQNIRKFLSILFNAPFDKNEYIEDLELKDKKASIAIKLQNVKNAIKYKNFFLNYLSFADVSKMVVKKGALVVEFKL